MLSSELRVGPTPTVAPPPPPRPSRKAHNLVGALPLTPTARSLLTEDVSDVALLQTWLERGLLTDAVWLLAAALPPIDAVWWSCLCVRYVLPANAPPCQRRALQSAVRWVTQPSEAHRRDAAQWATGDTMTAFTARAAALGGSSSSADAPVPPRPSDLARMVGGAVLLASLQAGPAKLDRLARQFLVMAVELQSRPDHWKPRPNEAWV